MFYDIKKPLFVLAHPDDEILYSHALQQFPEASVLIATDGTAGTDNRPGYHNPDFIAQGGRRHEALRALGSIGITDPKKLHHGELTDGNLDHEFATLAGKIVALALDPETRYDAIISFDDTDFQSPEDDLHEHSDHIATYRAARLAGMALRMHSKYTNLPHLVRTVEPADLQVVTITGDSDFKKSLLLHHQSQFPAVHEAALKPFERYARGWDSEHYRIAA